MTTVWAERGPGVPEARTSPDLDGSVEVILDPSLSPDWVRIPDTAPEGLAGRTAKVVRSLWFPLGVNPNWTPDSGESPWVETSTRWHIIRPESLDHLLGLAEVVGEGWVLVDLGPVRVTIMLEWEESDG